MNAEKEFEDMKFHRQAAARVKALRKTAWSPGASTQDLLRYIAALLEVCAHAKLKDQMRR